VAQGAGQGRGAGGLLARSLLGVEVLGLARLTTVSPLLWTQKSQGPHCALVGRNCALAGAYEEALEAALTGDRAQVIVTGLA